MKAKHTTKREFRAGRGKTHETGSSVSEYVHYSDGTELFMGLVIEGVKPYRIAERIASLMNQAYAFGKQDAFDAPVTYVVRIGNVELRQVFADARPVNGGY